MSLAVSTSAEPGIELSQDDRMIDFNLELSESTNAKLDRIANDMGVTKDELFARAFALLELAVNASKEGKRIAFVDADNVVERIISLD